MENKIKRKNLNNSTIMKKLRVQEAQRVPYRINPRGNSPRHILIKLTKTKDKERILKAAREKQQVTYKGNPILLTADFSDFFFLLLYFLTIEVRLTFVVKLVRWY